MTREAGSYKRRAMSARITELPVDTYFTFHSLADPSFMCSICLELVLLNYHNSSFCSLLKCVDDL